MIGALAIAASLASSNAALDQCRKLDKEFDTKAMVKPCQAAADDATLSIPERVEALRLVAFAHILNNDEELAEPAFMKMLVFSPGVELPADAGPKPREVFKRVQETFEKEGKVTATFTPPDPKTPAPVNITVDVADKLGRVVAARVKTHGSVTKEDRLVRAELGPGQARFTGTVPEPDAAALTAPTQVPYEVVLEGWDGTAVPTTAPVTGALERGGEAVTNDDGGGFPWLFVGIGAGAAVLAGGAVAGGVAWCFLAGPCRTQEAWVRVQVKTDEDSK